MILQIGANVDSIIVVMQMKAKVTMAAALVSSSGWWRPTMD